VLGGRGVHVVRHRIGPVGDPGEGLGQGERGALGVGEERRVAPSRHGVDPFVALTGLAQVARVHVDAHAAPVDLAGAQVRQLESRERDAGVLHGGAQVHQRAGGGAQGERGIGHPCGHLGPPVTSTTLGASLV
jgi:hypothetical protein